MSLINEDRLFLFTKISLIIYLALIYPQYGTVFKEAFFLSAAAGTVLLCLRDRAGAAAYVRLLRKDPLFWGMSAAAVWGLVASLVLSGLHHDPLQEMDLFRKVILKGIITYIIITYFCFREQSVRTVFIVLALVGAVACLDVLASYGLDFFNFSNRDAVKTFFHKKVHVNIISIKLNFFAPFLVAWSWYFGSRKEGSNRAVYFVIVVVLVASFFTISRAGWLGAVGGIFFLLLFLRAGRPLFIYLIIFCVVFGLAYAGSKDIRMHVETLKHRLPQISERLPNWNLCLKAVGQRFIWGWGVQDRDTFHRMVRAVDGNNSKILKYPHPHNVFLELSLMWGIPFLFIFLSMFLYIYWKAWGVAPHVDLSLRVPWGGLVGASLGSLWINGFFSEILWPNVFLAVALASSLIALGHEKVDTGR